MSWQWLLPHLQAIQDRRVLQSRNPLNSENRAGTWHLDAWAMIQKGSEENEQRKCSAIFPKVSDLCPHMWTALLCIGDSVPLVMMLPDELWQTRPGHIRPRFWPSISYGGRVVPWCLYNLICYPVGQLLQQSWQKSLHRWQPHCKPFNGRSSIKFID